MNDATTADQITTDQITAECVADARGDALYGAYLRAFVSARARGFRDRDFRWPEGVELSLAIALGVEDATSDPENPRELAAGRKLRGIDTRAELLARVAFHLEVGKGSEAAPVVIEVSREQAEELHGVVAALHTSRHGLATAIEAALRQAE